MAQYDERICNCILPTHQNGEIGIRKAVWIVLNIGINKLPVAPQLVADLLDGNNGQMLMYGKVSQENYVELTAASAIPNKEIKSPQILRY